MISLRSFMNLFGGFLLHLTLGTGYTFGNMSPYIISYFHSFGEKPNIAANDAMWVLSIATAAQGLFMSLGGVIDNYVGPRITAYIGSLLASFGVAVSYFTIKTNLPIFAITYGFIFGMGIGLAYTSPLSAGMKWYPNSKGLVNGIIVGGFGSGASIFTLVQTRYLNPDNSRVDEHGYFTDPHVINHVPSIFLLLGGIYGTLQLIGCSMLTLPEEIKEEEPIVDTNNEASVDSNYGSVEKIMKYDFELSKVSEEIIVKDDIVLYQSFTPKQILRYRQFYILWFTFFFNTQIIAYMMSMYKSYGQTFIKDDQFLATVGSIAALCNASGRIVWGLLIDRSNYKVCMLVLTAGLCFFMSTLPLTPSGGKFMFAVWIWLIFFVFSGTFTLFPTCTTQTFGIAHAGINYGLVFSSTVISGPLAAIITQNFTTLIGANGVIWIFAGFAIFSFLLTLFFKELQHCN